MYRRGSVILFFKLGLFAGLTAKLSQDFLSSFCTILKELTVVFCAFFKVQNSKISCNNVFFKQIVEAWP